MAQQEIYGNWLGPKRLQRQPGIYSVAGKLSPLGASRPGSPDSLEPDYDDVSAGEPERGPPGKGVYLLAGPPGSSRAPAPKDPEELELNSRDSPPNSWDLARNSGNWTQNSWNLAQNFGNSAQNPGNSAQNFGNLAQNPGNSAQNFRNSAQNSGHLTGNSQDLAQNSWDLAPNSQDSAGNCENLAGNSGNLAGNSGNLAGNSGNSGNRGICWVLALLAALSALAWAALLLLGLGKERELRAELELLRRNLSGSWDTVQQEQTRLQFGIQQHQQQLQELTELLCRSAGSRRRCPPGWRSHAGSCFSFSRTALSWGGARRACAELGAHLAVIGSEEEQLFVLEGSERGRSYWLGLTDAEREGSWRWVTGEEPRLGFWDIWAPQPEREQKDCGALGPKGLWVSERCEELHRWICEKPGSC